MTVQINGEDISAAIEGLAWAGSVVFLLIGALVLYLLVRPPKHVRQQRKAQRRGDLSRAEDTADAAELWRTVDRMEERLEVLERALADHIERPALGRRDERRIFAPADEDRDSGRKA